MPVLPAKIPDIPESRADVVAARLARKVAPLFGVCWAGAPVPLTWVSDFAAISVSDIARGAPSPTRAEQAHADDLASEHWTVIGRAVAVARRGRGPARPLPNEIANATINRFGPDTKAALVLTATNALLAPVCDAIAEALAGLTSDSAVDLAFEARAAAWASLVLDAYRSQPALVGAGLQARAVQRALARTWVVGTPDGAAFARSELRPSSGMPARAPSVMPMELDVLDRTARALTDEGRGASPLGRLAVDLLVDRLVRLGTGDADGYVWLTEREPGRRLAEAFVPSDPAVTGFTEDLARVRATGPVRPGLPSVPDVAVVEALSLMARRCTVLALCAQLRAAFSTGDPDPLRDLDTLECLDQIDRLTERVLLRDDPVRLLVGCRVADMQVEIQRQDRTYDARLPEAVARLVERSRRILRYAETGRTSAGDAVDALFSGNVELLAVLVRHRVEPLAGLESAAAQWETLHSLWRRTLALLSLNAAQIGTQQAPPLPPPLAFHLHNFATFLGRHDDRRHVERAFVLFRDAVLPSRRAYFNRTGDYRPLLWALQNATGAALRSHDPDQSEGVDALDAIGIARGWILEALDASYTKDVLARDAGGDASDEATRFALLALPALLRGVETGVSPNPDADLAECAHLLAVADRFSERFTKIGGQYTRHAEIESARRRLSDVERTRPC